MAEKGDASRRTRERNRRMEGRKKKKKKEKRKKKGPCLRNRQNTHLDSILTFQTIEKKSIASVPRENRVI